MNEHQHAQALVVGPKTFLRRHIASALGGGHDPTRCREPEAGIDCFENEKPRGTFWFIFEPDGPHRWFESLAILTRGMTQASRANPACVVVVICAVRESLASPAERAALEQALGAARQVAREQSRRLVTVRVGATIGEPEPPDDDLASNLRPLIAALIPEFAKVGHDVPCREDRILHLQSGSQLARSLVELNATLGAVESVYIEGRSAIRLSDLGAVGNSLLKTTITPCIPCEEVVSSLSDAIDRLTGEWTEGARDDGEQCDVCIDDVANVLAAHIRDLSRGSAQSFFRGITCETSDAMPLRAYHRPALGETMVFVNAYGVSPDITVPLARELQELDWYSLQSRNVPVLAPDYDVQRTGVGQHAEDLLTFLNARGLDAVHLAGWCTGAQVVLRFAHEHPQRVRSLTLVNGAFSLSSLRQVPFHQAVIGLLDRAASDVPSAGVLRQMMYSRTSLECARAFSAGEEHDNSPMPRQRDPHVSQMLTQLFTTAESLNRYARMAVRLWEEPGHAWTTAIRAPTLVLTGSRDRMSPPHTSVEVAGMIERSILKEVPEGDHYMLYLESKRVASLMQDFLFSAVRNKMPRVGQVDVNI